MCHIVNYYLTQSIPLLNKEPTHLCVCCDATTVTTYRLFEPRHYGWCQQNRAILAYGHAYCVLGSVQLDYQRLAGMPATGEYFRLASGFLYLLLSSCTSLSTELELLPRQVKRLVSALLAFCAIVCFCSCFTDSYTGIVCLAYSL